MPGNIAGKKSYWVHSIVHFKTNQSNGIVEMETGDFSRILPRESITNIFKAPTKSKLPTNEIFKIICMEK